MRFGCIIPALSLIRHKYLSLTAGFQARARVHDLKVTSSPEVAFINMDLDKAGISEY